MMPSVSIQQCAWPATRSAALQMLLPLNSSFDLLLPLLLLLPPLLLLLRLAAVAADTNAARVSLNPECMTLKNRYGRSALALGYGLWGDCLKDGRHTSVLATTVTAVMHRHSVMGCP